MKPISAKGRVRYPAASAMPTRVSAAEAQSDEDGATSLDPPRFVDWSAPEPLPPEAAPVLPAPSDEAGLVPARRAPAVLAWVAIAVLGVLSGLAGAFLAIWLAGGGG